MNEVEMETVINSIPSRRTIHSNDNEVQNNAPSPLWVHEDPICRGDFSMAGRQNHHSSLHPGGKEFSLLRSKNPICETVGWSAIL